MDGIVQEIASVVNTLQTLEITSTFDNMRKLLGCIQTLDEIVRKLDELKVEQPEIQIEPILTKAE